MKTFAAILDILFFWLCWPFTETNPEYQQPDEPEFDWKSFLR